MWPSSFTSFFDNSHFSVKSQTSLFHLLQDSMQSGVMFLLCTSPHKYIVHVTDHGHVWGRGYPKRQSVARQGRQLPGLFGQRNLPKAHISIELTEDFGSSPYVPVWL